MAHRSGQAVLLARHGETEWSLSGQHTGTTDIPLTDMGRRQAELLRPRMEERDYALVLTSPLGRARETCALAGLDAHAEIDEDLREYDYGDYEGITTKDIRVERPDWYLWRDGCPGGEMPEDAGRRADRLIERVLAAEGDVALFGHGHMLRVIGARWLELPPAAAGRLALGTGALCDLGFEREVRVTWLWNDTSHIDPPPFAIEH
jgi:broad specificity phosphatase PhoE